MNIHPIKRPINYDEYVDWNNNYYEDSLKYADFIDKMMEEGHSKEKATELWTYNLGVLPPSEPERIYQCNILDSDLKLVVTVLRRNDILENQKEFEVVKLNRLFLDSYDYKRVLIKENGLIKFKVIYKDLSRPQEYLPSSNETMLEDRTFLRENEKNVYLEDNKRLKGEPINYEDSVWFTSLAVSDLLNRMQIHIKEQNVSAGQDVRPSLFIYGMDFMEATEIEIIDKEFEKQLFSYIEKRFQSIVSELK